MYFIFFNVVYGYINDIEYKLYFEIATLQSGNNNNMRTVWGLLSFNFAKQCDRRYHIPSRA